MRSTQYESEMECVTRSKAFYAVDGADISFIGPKLMFPDTDRAHTR